MVKKRTALDVTLNNWQQGIDSCSLRFEHFRVDRLQIMKQKFYKLFFQGWTEAQDVQENCHFCMNVTIIILINLLLHLRHVYSVLNILSQMTSSFSNWSIIKSYFIALLFCSFATVPMPQRKTINYLYIKLCIYMYQKQCWQWELLTP